MVPALAVATELRAEGAEVLFIGADRAEVELVPQAGFQFHQIAVEGLSRTNPLRAARALGLSIRALANAYRLLGKLEPDAVMGGGGYVAGPVGLAAIMRRIPLVLTEADSHLGLTNRALAPFAQRVCLSFEIAGRTSSRYLCTGRPVMRVSRERDGARESLGVGAEERLLVVFGGSLGARSINYAAIDAFATGQRDYAVLHIAGRRDYPELSARELPVRYRLLDYLDQTEFSAALGAADLVIARSGGSVFEMAASGVPAVLVPYPHAAADHQTVNARWMAEAGAAVVIADRDLNAERLAATVEELFADPGRLGQMASASLGLARPQAAAQVADELLRAARG